MARTTITKVSEALGHNYDGTSDLSQWVSIAASIVDRLATLDTGGVLNSAALEQIETLVACHYYTIMDPLKTFEAIGKSQAQYVERSYLDAAKSLDFTDNLRIVMSPKRKTATMGWLGKAPSAQTDYEDRD